MSECVYMQGYKMICIRAPGYTPAVFSFSLILKSLLFCLAWLSQHSALVIVTEGGTFYFFFLSLSVQEANHQTCGS